MLTPSEVALLRKSKQEIAEHYRAANSDSQQFNNDGDST
jgi:hypothetical protein